MRLIDADAEITKIEEEIQRLRKAIERWQSRQLEGSTLYDTDEKIQELQNNITDCRMEIRIFKKRRSVLLYLSRRYLQEGIGGRVCRPLRYIMNI